MGDVRYILDTYEAFKRAKARGEELGKVLKRGDMVLVNAAWAPFKKGTCEGKDALGFRVRGLWFGWHELERIVEP